MGQYNHDTTATQVAENCAKAIEGESQFAINYLVRFLLTNLISSRLAPGGRIVNLASIGHELSPVLEDPNFDDGKTYTPRKGYGQSKTVLIMFTTALKPRVTKRNISAFAVHPGVIKTPIEDHVTKEMWDDIAKLWEETHSPGDKMSELSKNILQCSGTTVFAAFEPGLNGKSGAYLADCGFHQCKPYAIDLEEAERLWSVSEKLVGQSFD